MTIDSPAPFPQTRPPWSPAVRLEDTARLLARLGFDGPDALRGRIDRLAEPRAQGALMAALPYLLLLLGDAASPDRALVAFERFAERVPDQVAFYTSLADDPRQIETLVTLFAGSQYLTEILLRNPSYFDRLATRNGIGHIKSRVDLQAEAEAAVDPAAAEPVERALDALRHFQQWELLRIGLGDLTGQLDMATVTLQLSYLADAVVQTCLGLLARHLSIDPAGFVVVAMGKLGGEELNYSSDIDLLMLADADAARFARLGEHLIKALSQATAAGFLYRVDMRLRPWGRVGPLVNTVDGYLAYLKKHARLWEKQALLKARPIAGSQQTGGEFLRRSEPLLYETGDAASVRADVHGMKQRTEEQLRQRGRNWGEVKLGEGSIRDVEFVVQYLQLVHGGAHAELRTGKTLDALERLAEQGLLTRDERRILRDGYVFLRTVEHYLQILDYRQTYSLPTGAADQTYLAQRLGYHGPEAAEEFVTRYGQHSAAIRTIYRRYLAQPPADVLPPDNGVNAMQHNPAPPNPGPVGLANEPASSAASQHVARMTPSYAAVFDGHEIRRHADLAARLSRDNPVEVRAEPLRDNRWRVTIVGFDYLGELTLICGLLFAYGFSIVDGYVFTYEPLAPAAGEAVRQPQDQRKIVDVFTVRAVAPDGDPGVWLRYAGDLSDLVFLLQARRQRDAQGELAKRVALAISEIPGASPAVQPIDIDVDNESDDRYTILRIQGPDTIGFLYELTNALALNGLHIAHVAVASTGNRIHDTLYITDTRGEKIVEREKQRELRAATVLVKHFTHLLPYASNPETALAHFHEFLGQLFARPGWPDELASLERPEVLNALAQLLGVSDFLWDDFLRMQHENLFPVVQDVASFPHARTRPELASELDDVLRAAIDEVAGVDRRTTWRNALNGFKDREMFRIDMRNILGYIPNPAQFSAELTDLAEVVIEATLRLCQAELEAQYGRPLREDGQPSLLTVVGLGKCGGREMGYASDIELMFIYDSNGQTTGPRLLTTTEFYERLVQEVRKAIRTRHEGSFDLDLQLRPYGSAGSLAVSLAAFRRYFAPGGPAWSYERQALIKLRPIAGDAALGEQVQALRDGYVYGGEPFDVPAMRAMRERQLRHLVTPGRINAKYSPGGLVDVEYLIQGLQINHGQGEPALHLTNTQEAMAALAWLGILSQEHFTHLRAAHLFLQRLVDALRVVRGHAKDLTVPLETDEEFAFLARRMGYANNQSLLSADLADHIANVQMLNTSLLG
ncbi:MAG: hypothetical protein R2844_22720 [Caldilineales bacterium]